MPHVAVATQMKTMNIIFFIAQTITIKEKLFSTLYSLCLVPELLLRRYSLLPYGNNVKITETVQKYIKATNRFQNTIF